MSKTDWESNNTWAYLKGRTMRKDKEAADQTLSGKEVVEALCSSDELKYLIAREVWNKRHPDQPIGELSPRT